MTNKKTTSQIPNIRGESWWKTIRRDRALGTHPTLFSEAGAHETMSFWRASDWGGSLVLGTSPSWGYRGRGPSCRSPKVHSCGHPAYLALYSSLYKSYNASFTPTLHFFRSTIYPSSSSPLRLLPFSNKIPLFFFFSSRPLLILSV